MIRLLKQWFPSWIDDEKLTGNPGHMKPIHGILGPILPWIDSMFAWDEKTMKMWINRGYCKWATNGYLNHRIIHQRCGPCYCQWTEILHFGVLFSLLTRNLIRWTGRYQEEKWDSEKPIKPWYGELWKMKNKAATLKSPFMWEFMPILNRLKQPLILVVRTESVALAFNEANRKVTFLKLNNPLLEHTGKQKHKTDQTALIIYNWQTDYKRRNCRLINCSEFKCQTVDLVLFYPWENWFDFHIKGPIRKIQSCRRKCWDKDNYLWHDQWARNQNCRVMHRRCDANSTWWVVRHLFVEGCLWSQAQTSKAQNAYLDVMHFHARALLKIKLQRDS